MELEGEEPQSWAGGGGLTSIAAKTARLLLGASAAWA